ncbi:MAG: hypothetical protein OEW06_08745 [Gemmatimonadota bacterium]|nr:hypothetical protein [Gemmatimonadota bacterium]MDH4350679.1 hypothetical protein [Gemmatimonadota bacterium]
MGTLAMTEAATQPRVDDEQWRYASILQVGVDAGLLVLLVTFALYVSGIVAPSVPLHELPNYWELSVHEYLEATNAEHLHHEHVITGWAWLSVVGKGDYLNFVGIALLGGVTIVCFLGILPALLRKGDRIYAVMAGLEVLVLTLAASGLLAVGH